jgi:hypothetical protein
LPAHYRAQKSTPPLPYPRSADALNMALVVRRPNGVIYHSDSPGPNTPPLSSVTAVARPACAPRKSGFFIVSQSRDGPDRKGALMFQKLPAASQSRIFQIHAPIDLESVLTLPRACPC